MNLEVLQLDQNERFFDTDFTTVPINTTAHLRRHYYLLRPLYRSIGNGCKNVVDAAMSHDGSATRYDSVK